MVLPKGFKIFPLLAFVEMSAPMMRLNCSAKRSVFQFTRRARIRLAQGRLFNREQQRGRLDVGEQHIRPECRGDCSRQTHSTPKVKGGDRWARRFIGD